MATEQIGRIALLWRGDRVARTKAKTTNNRLSPLFEALATVNVAAEPAVYSDEIVDEVRDQLLGLDGVLVWVDPISDGHDRSKLDPYTRRAKGRVASPPRIRTARVETESRQRWHRNVEGRARRARHLEVGLDTIVRVLHARRGGVEEDLRLGDFMSRCEQYFAADGRIIDQPFQPRLQDGMIRCYMVRDKVAGFGHQLIKALMPSSPGTEPAEPGPRIMYEADEPAFQALRRKMESEWTPAMMRILNIDGASLPVIWDADFLYGPKTESGEDIYVLCEINVSAVFPFPEQATAKIAHDAAMCMLSAKKSRLPTRG